MFVIEPDIPIPHKNRGRGYNTYYPFPKMAIGDSFLITTERPISAEPAISAAYKYGKRTGTQFTGRRVGPREIRIWRVA